MFSANQTILSRGLKTLVVAKGKRNGVRQGRERGRTGGGKQDWIGPGTRSDGGNEVGWDGVVLRGVCFGKSQGV